MGYFGFVELKTMMTRTTTKDSSTAPNNFDVRVLSVCVLVLQTKVSRKETFLGSRDICCVFEEIEN